MFFCDRKKVGNFIAGNDTSQSAQAEQQGSYADGKHTSLPVDQYLFLGMKYDIHFLTVDVTTFGKSKYASETFAVFILVFLCLICDTTLLAKHDVKMAGYWPIFFLCVFMDQDRVEVHKLTKKNEANIQPS